MCHWQENIQKVFKHITQSSTCQERSFLEAIFKKNLRMSIVLKRKLSKKYSRNCCKVIEYSNIGKYWLGRSTAYIPEAKCNFEKL